MARHSEGCAESLLQHLKVRHGGRLTAVGGFHLAPEESALERADVSELYWQSAGS